MPSPQKPHKKYKALKITALCLVLAVLAGTVGFFAYTSNYARAGHETAGLYTAQDLHIRHTNSYTCIQPLEGTPTVGYIFYPGGLVDTEAYLLYLADVAREGYFCAVVEVPFHLAILGSSRADVVVSAHPEIDTWVVGGHSLGGVAAATYTAAESHDVAGIVFLASYPTVDLSSEAIPAVSVTAASDGVLNWDSYNNAQAMLPPDTRFVLIEGGNHAGFGDYGPQKGDGEASITGAEQRAGAVAATLEVLREAAA